jgi:hypothetical protein
MALISEFVMRLIIASLLLLATSVVAQTNPYVVEGSIGKVEKPPSHTGTLATLELPDWIGQRFILLPQPMKLQEYGYQSFEPHLSYSKWVGKVLTVTSVTSGVFPVVTFKTEHGNVRATAYTESINGIGPVRDIDYARVRWLGKFLWLKTTGIVTYDAASDSYGNVRLGRTARVKVKNIVAGWYNHEPVRFILLSDDGREGFVDVQLTGTNVSAILRNQSRVQDRFDETDPRARHKDWSSRVWKAIGEEKVFIGMSADQARLSWGEPNDINRTIIHGERSEQWVYGEHTYLYVKNGVVTAVQN